MIVPVMKFEDSSYTVKTSITSFLLEKQTQIFPYDIKIRSVLFIQRLRFWFQRNKKIRLKTKPIWVVWSA